jgi:hypothetical protein
MENALTPEWIRHEESQRAMASARADAVTQRTTAALLEIEASAPGFWRQLLLELKLNTESLPRIGVRGQVSTVGSEKCGHAGYRVDVASKCIRPDISYSDVFYSRGDSAIRTLTLEGTARNFTFCVLPKGKGIAVIPDDGFAPISARTMAEMVVRQVVSEVTELAS